MQGCGEPGRWRLPVGVRQTRHLRRGCWDKIWIPYSRQERENRAVEEFCRHISGHLKRQACLSDSSRSRQRETYVITEEEGLQCLYLAGAPDEASKRPGQVNPPDVTGAKQRDRDRNGPITVRGSKFDQP